VLLAKVFKTPLGDFNLLERAIFRKLYSMQPFTRGDLDSFGLPHDKIKKFLKARYIYKVDHPTQDRYEVDPALVT